MFVCINELTLHYQGFAAQPICSLCKPININSIVIHLMTWCIQRDYDNSFIIFTMIQSLLHFPFWKFFSQQKAMQSFLQILCFFCSTETSSLLKTFFTTKGIPIFSTDFELFFVWPKHFPFWKLFSQQKAIPIFQQISISFHRNYCQHG